MSTTGADNTTIGSRLRILRQWRGMTRAELADLSGISARYLSMAEGGLRPVDRRSMISALAAALQVSEAKLTGGPRLGSDPMQSGPHLFVPALRNVLADNAIGEPAGSHARQLPDVTAEVTSLRIAHAAGDYLSLGQSLPGILSELYLHVSDPRGERDQRTAARALVDVCGWSAWMCHNLQYGDLAQLAARAALNAAKLADDPVTTGQAHFAWIGTGPRGWAPSLSMAMRAANQLQPHARDPLGFQVLGMLTLRCALATAALQDQAATMLWLGEAAALAGQVDDSDPVNAWEWFGATNVAIWRTALAVELGEGGRALLELASAADPAKLTVGTRRASLYLEVGRGLARDRSTQAAATRWLRRAEDAAPQWIRNYPSARETVAFLLTRATSTAGSSELRGMAARMSLSQ